MPGFLDQVVGQPLEGFSGAAALISGKTPLSSIPANPDRMGCWHVQNQGTATLTVALDDGQNGGLSVLLLLACTVLGAPGGAIGHEQIGPHRGRIRVFGTTGAQFSMRVQ